MDTVITILENIIDEHGTQYLQRNPYAVYQKLISEKARPDYARLVLITLLCNASVKAGEMDEAELSKDLQNGCFLRKKAADEIAAMYKKLFSEENVSSWKKKEYSGFKEFCECTWEFEWEGSGKWSRGGGYHDCWASVLADVKVEDKTLAEKVVSKLLKKNPFTDEDTIFQQFQNKMEEALEEDFHDYVTCDDYYPPVMEDYDAEYALSKCCKELGLKIVHVSSSGDMSDFEPDDMRW